VIVLAERYISNIKSGNKVRKQEIHVDDEEAAIFLVKRVWGNEWRDV
jgi:hypothetical protein